MLYLNANRSFFSTNQIKIIALITMIIDHIALFVPTCPIWFRYVGRLSAPLFIFCLVWGMDYTKSRPKYILRLFIATVGMEITWYILKHFYSISLNRYPNVFHTHLLIALLIELIFPRERKLSKSHSILIILLLSGNIIYNDWGTFGCLLGIIMYKFKNNSKSLIYAYIGCCAYYEFISVTAFYARLAYFANWHLGVIGKIFELLCVIMTGEIYAFTPMVLHGLYLDSYQWMMIGALPIMLLFNTKQGYSTKWFFYIIYPLHFLLIILFTTI